MKNKILLFLMVFLMFFVSFINSAKATNDLTKVDKEYEKYLERNWSQVELATKVYNRISDYYGIKDTFKDKYPSYFGGMYISDDALYLVIQIVENKIPEENSKDYSIYKEIINMDDSIQIQAVKNSYNELNELNNYISDNLLKEKGSSKSVTSSYLDIINNSVGVELIDNNPEKQENLKNIISESKSLNFSKIIKFNQTKKYTTSASNIAAGARIWLTSAQTSYCSMGMRVKYNGNNGYLTAGHCAKEYSSFPSGTVKVVQFSNNQNYDYAFIQTNSSYIPTNTLAYTTTGITKLGLINYCPSIIVNMAISKAGVRTGYTTGKVKALNVSVYYSDVEVTLKGMIESDVYQGQGDSGGVVMIPRTDANGGAIGIGILSGGVNLYNKMYFSDINVYPIALQNRY